MRTIAFLWGLQFAFLSPALALLLVSLFGASTGQIAIVLAIYNAACLGSSWVIPRWADRHRDYVRPMFGCGVFTVGLCVVLLVARSLPVGVAGLVLLGAPAAVGTPLLFGYVRHSGAPPSEVVRARAMFSMAWVAGPPVAALIISGAGGHALVLGIGLVGALNMLTIGLMYRSAHSRPTGTPAAHAAPSPHTLVPRTTIALLVVAFAVLQSTNTAAVAITTLFATRTLHLTPVWGGVALGVAAGLEVPALLLLSRGSRRIGELPLLSLACLAAIAYYIGVSVAPNGYVLIGLQVLNAGFVAVVAGVGLTLFQSIVAGPGAAAGLMSNAQRGGALMSGPLIGLGSLLGEGLRTVFLAAAVVALLSFGLFRLAARRIRTTPSTPSTTGAARAGDLSEA